MSTCNHYTKIPNKLVYILFAYRVFRNWHIVYTYRRTTFPSKSCDAFSSDDAVCRGEKAFLDPLSVPVWV